MSEISATLVKTLRERTGAGMMDCKKALGETGGDLEAAIDWLRKKGLAAAAKKAGRVAAEGLVGVSSQGKMGAIVEVNAETDFVGRNELFQEYVRQTATAVLSHGPVLEQLSTVAYPGSEKSFAEQLTHLVAVIGENMHLRRARRLEVKEGIVATYVHNAIAPQLGRIGVLVALESTADPIKLQELGKQIAMHIAATNPQSLSVTELNPELIERERSILTEQAKASGRPDSVIEKMIEGRLRKFYEEVVLLEQAFVMDPAQTVGKVIEAFGKDNGASVTLTAFARYALGEGIEKQEANFADEVAAMSQAG